MLFSWLYNHIEDEDLKESLVVGLVGGLIGGLVVGLVGGLVFGLVFGLVVGSVFGLIGGLVFGLVGGLVFGLVFGLVGGLVEIYNSSIESFVFLLFILLVISEILYWLDKYKWDDVGRWGNTLLKKAESFFESGIVVVNVCNIWNHWRDVVSWFGDKGDELHLALSVVGYGTVIVLFVGGFIWLNSLKYCEKKEVKKKK